MGVRLQSARKKLNQHPILVMAGSKRPDGRHKRTLFQRKKVHTKSRDEVEQKLEEFRKQGRVVEEFMLGILLDQYALGIEHKLHELLSRAEEQYRRSKDSGALKLWEQFIALLKWVLE